MRSDLDDRFPSQKPCKSDHFRVKADQRLYRPWALGEVDRAMICCRRNREFSMRALRLAAAIMLLASPAFAQIPKLNLLQDKPGKTQEEKDADAAQEKAYKDSLKKIPDAKQSSDPWGSVRSDAPAAPAKSASSAKAKAKTGTSAGASAN
jgi:hypothetical protein